MANDYWCGNGMEFIHSYLAEQGFSFVNGFYQLGDNSLNIHCKEELGYIFVSVVKFPKCERSPEIALSNMNHNSIKNFLDILIFTIKG